MNPNGRKKYIHQEKTVEISTPTAGIVYGIGNPLAATAELVGAMRENDAWRSLDHEELYISCDAVLQHPQRITAILRDVSDFSATLSGQRELLDLNQLIRTTYQFMRYDKRLLKIGCALELDSELPAIEGNEEQLIQVIMSLLVNAADAVEGLNSRLPVICISTHAASPAAAEIFIRVNTGLVRAETCSSLDGGGSELASIQKKRRPDVSPFLLHW